MRSFLFLALLLVLPLQAHSDTIFTLKSVEDSRSDGLLRVRVSLSDISSAKGYGFTLLYDQDKYEFYSSERVYDNIFDYGFSERSLFIATNNTPGQIHVAAVRIDKESVSGSGDLVEFAFKTRFNPLPGDFKILGVSLVDISSEIIDVSKIIIDDISLLLDCELYQNVPNPFNPETAIKYNTNEPGEVKIIIYNLLGQEIRTLVNDFKSPGIHTVVWDGKDEMGRQIASGIYIYQLVAGDFTAIKRMTLLK